MAGDEAAFHRAVREHRVATEVLAKAIYHVRSLPRAHLDVLTDLELEIMFRECAEVPLATRCIAASELLRRLASRSSRRGLPFRVLEQMLDELDRGSDSDRTTTLTDLEGSLHALAATLQNYAARIPAAT